MKLLSAIKIALLGFAVTLGPGLFAQSLVPNPFTYASCISFASPTGYVNCTASPDCAASRCTVPAGCTGQAVMCFGESFRYVLAAPMVVGQSYTISMSVSTGQLGASSIIAGNHTFNVIGLTSAPTNCGASNYGSVCSTPGATLLLSGTVNTIGWVNFSTTFVATAAFQHIVIGNCDGTGNGGNLFCNLSLTNAVVFPVELVDFHAQPNGCEVRLQWETGSNTTNMDRFELIRSVEGQSDRILTTMDVKSGANTYYFSDNAPALNANYQLRMLDLDGNESRSEVLFVESECHGQVNAIENNPVKGNTATLRYLAKGQALRMQVRNIEGRIVHEENLLSDQEGWKSMDFDVSGLLPGMYLVSTSDGQVVKMHVMR